MGNTLQFKAEAIRELSTQLVSGGLLLGWRIMKAEGATRETFLQMCGEVWDEIQALEEEH